MLEKDWLYKSSKVYARFRGAGSPIAIFSIPLVVPRWLLFPCIRGFVEEVHHAKPYVEATAQVP